MSAASLATASACFLFPLFSLAADPPKDPHALRDEALAALEKRVLYAPQHASPRMVREFLSAGGERLDFQTGQGRQTAWLIRPARPGPLEKLWLVCGGNGSQGLEFGSLCRRLPFQHDAYVLVDYPGYGVCEGEPSPDGLGRNVKEAALAAAKVLRLDPAALPGHTCVFGHSLGCAAALLGVQELHLHSAVLCAPFTTTADMARHIFPLLQNVPLQHPYDNRAGLAEIARNHGHAWILHGTNDEVIPEAMSESLAQDFREAVTLKTLPRAHHNDFFGPPYFSEVLKAMVEARK